MDLREPMETVKPDPNPKCSSLLERTDCFMFSFVEHM